MASFVSSSLRQTICTMNRVVAVLLSSFSLSPYLLAETNLLPRSIFPPTVAQSTVSLPPVPNGQSALVALAWDAESKDFKAKAGEGMASFVFFFTNISAAEVVISNVTTTCGCTVAQLPSQPWHLAPGTNGELKVTMNLAGKLGRVTKEVSVNSSAGTKVLRVRVTIPATSAAVTENARGDRAANMEAAKANRQAIFQGDCISCHVTKGAGKFGKELFVADCAICHDTPHRAAMVPDLRAPRTPRDHAYWANWITSGRAGSLMPAFGEKEGGPLSQGQIDSLVTYLMENFPKGPAGNSSTSVILPVIPTPSAGK